VINEAFRPRLPAGPAGRTCDRSHRQAQARAV